MPVYYDCTTINSKIENFDNNNKTTNGSFQANDRSLRP